MHVPLLAIHPPLSLTGRRWVLRRKEALEPTSLITTILAKERGINLAESLAGKLSDPYLFPEMSRAVERIEKAIKNKETIGIFGDYDADGITGTAQLVHALRRHGTEPVVYLPDRAKEGYGMKRASIDVLKKKGVTLLITVDTGITAHEEILYAHSLGMDVVITDHHRSRGDRPAALAVIHPQVPSEFPNTHLCGSGVAFMLVRALEHGNVWDGIDRDIVLAMIGTIGDVVPLTGENRTLVIHGLKFAVSLPPSPLRDFITSVVKLPHITSGDVAFRIVPRINAAGRMAHPEIALEALLKGGAALEKLHALNGDRQSFVEDLLEEADDIVDFTQPFLSAFSQTFTPGTVGLVAGRLTESSGKPSIVGAIIGDSCTASLRSVVGIDLVECLSHPTVKPLLTTFGGHAQAAGCSFPAENAAAIATALSKVLVDKGLDKNLLPTIDIDAELEEGEIDLRFVKSLHTLAPFGAQNEEPRFLMKSKKLLELRCIGTDGAHLQCRIDGLKAVGFRHGTLIEQLSSEESVDLVCRIGINTWQGREEAQFFIEDLRKPL